MKFKMVVFNVVCLLFFQSPLQAAGTKSNDEAQPSAKAKVSFLADGYCKKNYKAEAHCFPAGSKDPNYLSCFLQIIDIKDNAIVALTSDSNPKYTFKLSGNGKPFVGYNNHNGWIFNEPEIRKGSHQFTGIIEANCGDKKKSRFSKTTAIQTVKITRPN